MNIVITLNVTYIYKIGIIVFFYIYFSGQFLHMWRYEINFIKVIVIKILFQRKVYSQFNRYFKIKIALKMIEINALFSTICVFF